MRVPDFTNVWFNKLADTELQKKFEVAHNVITFCRHCRQCELSYNCYGVSRQKFRHLLSFPK